MGREASRRSRHLQAGSVRSDEGHCRKAKDSMDPCCVQGGSQTAQDEERWVVRKRGLQS